MSYKIGLWGTRLLFSITSEKKSVGCLAFPLGIIVCACRLFFRYFSWLLKKKRCKQLTTNQIGNRVYCSMNTCILVWSSRSADWASTGMVANPNCGQTNRKYLFFPVPVCA